ncbi:TM2 domain-containing protein [Clostridium oryzae]|uniref:TM2 domain protein n=1 Tax=Clostridium oryzae TaxID=1450648 RepID=A0A1V4IQS0_9CLOT|nr:TM2 domain-containing protein [Clostridium oryzae]OPJ62145.1 TM2 domain protein [Clostridium oryzae]
MENQNNQLTGSTVNVDTTVGNTKFCKFCGEKIPMEAVVCTKCGRQVEELKGAQQPNIVINNSNVNRNDNQVGGYMGRPKSKAVAILLCLFLGGIGAHKFYEGKIGMGILYLFTLGLFGIGALIDLIALIMKPSTYYVR